MSAEDTFIALVGEMGEAWIAMNLSAACEVHADAEGVTADEYNRWMELSQEADSLMVGIRTLLADEKARVERNEKRPFKVPAVRMLRVIVDDDEAYQFPMEEFIAANEFDIGLAEKIRAMRVGDELHEGGGAASEWSCQRIS